MDKMTEAPINAGDVLAVVARHEDALAHIKVVMDNYYRRLPVDFYEDMTRVLDAAMAGKDPADAEAEHQANRARFNDFHHNRQINEVAMETGKAVLCSACNELSAINPADANRDDGGDIALVGDGERAGGVWTCGHCGSELDHTCPSVA
jgi:hypothetical protein